MLANEYELEAPQHTSGLPLIFLLLLHQQWYILDMLSAGPAESPSSVGNTLPKMDPLTVDVVYGFPIEGLPG